MQKLIGQQLGQYKIVEQIGQGGMATVFKARQQGLERWVAVKVLPPHYATDPDFSRRFRREAQAIAGLEHPHILPVYDFGQQGPYTYLVMRYVEDSRTLAGAMRRPFSLARALNYLEQVAAALDYAHARGVIHRDIKPSNILLSDGWVFLADFGLARMLAAAEITTTGPGSGSPAYMSPEQGAGLKVDGRTDVYSLGVIAYLMLTGQIPHMAETTQAMIYRRNHQPPPSLRDLRPEVPPEVEQVIKIALAPEPEQRFQRAGQFVTALRRVVREAGVETMTIAPRAEPRPEPVSPPSPSPPSAESPAPTPARRPNRFWWLAGGLVLILALLVVAAGLTGLIIQSAGESRSSRTAVPAAGPTLTSLPLEEIFSDDFNGIGLEHQRWGFTVGSGQIQVYDGVLRLTSAGQAFPLVYARQNPFPAAGDFTLNVDLRYLSAAERGSGLRISASPLTRHIGLGNPDSARDRIVEIWQDADTWHISVGEQNMPVYRRPAPDLNRHEVEIRYQADILHILVDGAEVYTSDALSARPTGLWLGNPLQAASAGKWSGLEIARISLSAPEGAPDPAAGPVPTAAPAPTATATVTPTITPTPTPLVCEIEPAEPFAALWQSHRRPAGCPLGRLHTISTIAEESFEGGHTFWSRDAERVYIVYDRDKESGQELFEGEWQLADPDWQWDGSNPEGVGLSPPPGRVEPKRGFGWLWRTHLGGPEGPLGWALDQEYGFDNVGQVQRFENGLIFKGSFSKIYLLLDNGRFYAG